MLCVCVVCERESVCVCDREREDVCERERKGESVCVRVCEEERERGKRDAEERERERQRDREKHEYEYEIEIERTSVDCSIDVCCTGRLKCYESKDNNKIGKLY